jgi:hypothetical protein
MAELKTKPNEQSVTDFLNRVPDEGKRRDSFTLLDLMKDVTHEEPVMWGDAIVGFGSYHYRYASGREGDMPLTGFSHRKQNLTLYITSGFERYDALLQKLGKHSTSKACLYVKRLEDIDLPTLKELVRQSVEHMIQTNA